MYFFFFFFKQKTAYEMRISDWSSDVCSSDLLSLRDSFIIYAKNEVWTTDYIGGNYLFRWRKIYDKVGILNQNCVVQVDGLHYVFDKDEIYLHDGEIGRAHV